MDALEKIQIPKHPPNIQVDRGPVDSNYIIPLAFFCFGGSTNFLSVRLMTSRDFAVLVVLGQSRQSSPNCIDYRLDLPPQTQMLAFLGLVRDSDKQRFSL